VGLYRPRRPRASPLYRLLEGHFQAFSTVYDERFAHRFGYWRPVVAEVVEKFLACGILTPVTPRKCYIWCICAFTLTGTGLRGSPVRIDPPS
jgi:hypothetical protein